MSPRRDSVYDRFDGDEDGLDAMGRKNAKHAEEIHDEVELTRTVMARFLAKSLTTARPDDWKETCVDAAFEAALGKGFKAILPDHYDVESFDVRSLAIVMEHSLSWLPFERGATVSKREVRSFVTMRNIYEHKDTRLNYRRWKNDLEAIRSFRAKMQTEEEMTDESYTPEDLPRMEEETSSYLAKLETLQHQIEAITNTVLGLNKRLGDNAQVDEEQFAELNRQRKTDSEHDRLIEENAQQVAHLVEQNATLQGEVIGLACVSLVSLVVSLIALARKR